MNIGILLDPKNFLEYQGLLRTMLAKRGASFAVSANHLLHMLSDNWRGMTIAGLAAGLLGCSSAHRQQVSVPLDLRGNLDHRRYGSRRQQDPLPVSSACRSAALHARLHCGPLAGRAAKA